MFEPMFRICLGRHIRRVLAVAVLAMAVSGACFGGNATIKLAWWGENDGGKRIVEEFNKVTPGVEAIYVAYPTYHEKIPVEMAGGVGPDVLIFATGYFDYQPLADGGLLLDLTGLVKRDKAELGTDRWFPIPLQSASWNGQMPVLPFGWQEFGQLAFNRDIFQQAGLAYPTDTWTWPEMINAAKKLTVDTNADGAPDQWGLVPYDGFPGWYNLVEGYIRAAGGQVYDLTKRQLAINTPVAMNTIQLMLQPHLETGIFASFPGGWEVQPWIDGKAAMVLGWAEAQTYYYSSLAKFEAGNVPIPLHPATGKRSPKLTVSSLGINADTKYPDAAWQFVKFFVGARGQDAYADGIGFLQHLPVSRAVLESRGWRNPPKAPKGINPESFVVAAETGHIDQPFKGWTDSDKVLRELWSKAWGKQITLAQMIQEATTRVNQILADATKD